MEACTGTGIKPGDWYVTFCAVTVYRAHMRRSSYAHIHLG